MTPNKLIPAALVLIAACGSSEPSDGGSNTNPPAGTDIVIVLSASTKGPNAFSPSNLTFSLASQTTVKWWNGDFSGSGYGGNGVTHHLVSNDGVTFDSPQIQSRGTFTATFSAPGTYGYHCTIHPGMTGTLTVDP